MSIVKVSLKAAIMLVCSIIQVFTVFIGGIGFILVETAEALYELHGLVWKRRVTKKERRRAEFDVPL